MDRRPTHAAQLEGTSGSVAEERAITAQLAVVAIVAEAALAVLHVKFGWGFAPTLAAHCAIVTGCAYRLLAWSRGKPSDVDVMPGAMVVAATAVAGPVGALFALAIPRLSPRRGGPSPLLEAWYHRIALSGDIDAETRLCDNVGSGRTMNLASPPPQSFVEVMTAGGLADKQSALGLIARRFHPDYLPALALALKSPEPVVRVQAAAVAARVRDGLKTRVRALLDELEAAVVSPRAEARLPELAKAIASGLLDETDRTRAEALLAGSAVGFAVPDTAREPGPSPGHAPQSFKAFRVGRRKQSIEHRGRYRVRARVRPGTGHASARGAEAMP